MRPILTFASSVWSPFFNVYIGRIETVQHKFFRTIAPSIKYPNPFLDHNYAAISQFLNIPTLKSLRKLTDIIFLIKLCNHHLDSPDLLNELNFRVPIRMTRSITTFKLGNYSSLYTLNNSINRMYKIVNDENIDVCDIDLNLIKRDLKSVILEWK